MGYDAFIRCKCFEKGLTKPFKYSQYLTRDPDGYFELQIPKYFLGTPIEDEMKEDLWGWEVSACEHEDQEYFSTRLCNNAGMSHFRSTIDILNGEKNLPTLYKYIPQSNDGMVPLEENENFRNDLLKMINAGKIRNTYCYVESNNDYIHIANVVNGDTETFFIHPLAHMGLSDDSFFISIKDEIVFRSKKFTVSKQKDKYLFFDNKRKVSYLCDIFFNETLFNESTSISIHVESEIIDIKEAHGYIIESLLTLIDKSNEIGNPINWA